MVIRCETARSTAAVRRFRPLALVTLAAMAALTVLTAGAEARQARPAAPTEATAPREAGEPIMAIVSIKSQQVTFYDADGWIFRAPVSTGTTGRETPAGVFALVEKDKDHHSTMYDDAWMPNMQRITWNGIALHGGPLPGYAASHGCVRMPYDFAEKMFDRTSIGMRVIISPNDAAPVEFTHPALFEPKAEALAAAPARAEKLSLEAEDAARAANEAKAAAATATRDTATLNASLRKLEQLNARAQAELAYADKMLANAKTDQAKAKAEELKQKVEPKAAEAQTQLDAAKADVKPKLDAAAGAKDAAKAAAAKKAETAKAASEAKLALEPVVDLHQPRDAKALRKAQYPQGVGGWRRGVRFQHRGSGHDPQSRPTDRHAYLHGDGAQRFGLALERSHDRQRRRRQGRTRPHHHPAGCARRASRRPRCRDPRSSSRMSRLSKETNYRTEFVAVLSNQPQGGFITRKPTTTEIPVASGDDGNFFGSFFQRSWDPQGNPQPGNPQAANTRLRGQRYPDGRLYPPQAQQGWGW